MRKAPILAAALAGLALVGSGCAPGPLINVKKVEGVPFELHPTNQAPAPDINAPSEPPPAPPAPPTRTILFGKPATFGIGEAVYLEDKTVVRLSKIDDSRCAEGVQCIWAGQLAPTFRLSGNDIPYETGYVELGTLQTKVATAVGYRFVLDAATEDTATVTITKVKTPAKTTR